MDAVQRHASRFVPQLDRNGRIVVVARALRSFAFGLKSVALGLFLSQSVLPATQIGLILSTALAGTLALTVVIAGWAIE